MNDLMTLEGSASPRTRYEPQSLAEGYELAKRIAQSGLVPTGLRGKPDDVFLVMAQGAELGLTTMQALRGLYVIEGRVAMAADLMAALCVGSSICEFFRCVEQVASSATWETKRRGSEPQRVTFTYRDAEKANLLSRKNWQRYPARMCSARAKAFLARDVYPDLVGGFHTPDELGSAVQADSPPGVQSIAPPGPLSSEVAAHVERLDTIPEEREEEGEREEDLQSVLRRSAKALYEQYPLLLGHWQHAARLIARIRQEDHEDEDASPMLALDCRYEAEAELRARRVQAQEIADELGLDLETAIQQHFLPSRRAGIDPADHIRQVLAELDGGLSVLGEHRGLPEAEAESLLRREAPALTIPEIASAIGRLTAEPS